MADESPRYRPASTTLPHDLRLDDHDTNADGPAPGPPHTSKHRHSASNLTYLSYTSNKTVNLPSLEPNHQVEIPTRASSWKRASVSRTSPRKTKLGKQYDYFPESEPVSPPPPVRMSVTSSSDRETLETRATSMTLGPLQAKDEHDHLAPIEDEGDDPASYDLVAPASEAETNGYSLEKRSEQLFSREHLLMIFSDPSLLLKFTGFLSNRRPSSVQVLIYYLDALKAIRAISYSNAIAEALEPMSGHSFTGTNPIKTVNKSLEDKANQAFDLMVQEDLPSFITSVYVNIVSESITKRITGTLPPHLREASEGLAEVFCLTDPSRPDNPIVFASEEFHRTTQYGVNYAIGRNCRFLQGPKTNRHSVQRLKEACEKGKEHCEVFLNYRRDGSQFMNMLMIAPLRDSRGTIRYFIGAQVDVSGLVRDCTGLESLNRLLEQQSTTSSEPYPSRHTRGASASTACDPATHFASDKDEFQSLSEMFNASELSTVRQRGGRMHSQTHDTDDTASVAGGSGIASHRPRLLLKENSDPEDAPSLPFAPAPTSSTHPLATGVPSPSSGRLLGVYQNYLLLRPYPSLRILFASPSLRVPGMLQSPFLDRIGGSSRVQDELEAAFAEGRGVTAKVRWLTRADAEGRARWIHCTPLLGSNGHIGVWMVVLVDTDGSGNGTKRRWKAAPVIGAHGEVSLSQGREREEFTQRGEWEGPRWRAEERDGVKAMRSPAVRSRENLRRGRGGYEESLAGSENGSGYSLTLR